MTTFACPLCGAVMSLPKFEANSFGPVCLGVNRAHRKAPVEMEAVES